jgi:hypothetical protein
VLVAVREEVGRAAEHLPPFDALAAGECLAGHSGAGAGDGDQARQLECFHHADEIPRAGRLDIGRACGCAAEAGDYEAGVADRGADRFEVMHVGDADLESGVRRQGV